MYADADAVKGLLCFLSGGRGIGGGVLLVIWKGLGGEGSGARCVLGGGVGASGGG